MIRPLFVLTALVACAGFARPTDDERPGPKIEWPDVKGLKRQTPEVSKNKKLGYSVSYQSDGTIIAVFVYNFGRDKIPDGPDSDAVLAEMYESLLLLEENKTGKKPSYKSLSPLDEKVIPLGPDPNALHMRRKRYEAERIGEGPIIAELYMTGYKNHFIKIRATYPAGDKEKCQKQLSDLLDALGKELK
jgi:hypothetical protein